MLFSHHFQHSIRIWIKSEIIEIQDGNLLLRHLCNYGCHGNELDSMWKVQRKLIMCAKYHVNRMNGVESRGEGSGSPYAFV